MGVVRRVVDYHTDGGIGTKILDIQLRLVGEIPFRSQKEYGPVVIGAVGLRVDSPEKMISRVNVIVDLDLLGRCWLYSRGEGVYRDSEGEIIISAGARIWHVPGRTIWCLVCISFIIVYRS